MTMQRSTVAAAFDSRDDAEQAVAALNRAGFTDEHIGWARRQDEGVPEGAKDKAGDAAGGATAGMLTGGALGAAGAAAGMALIPGVGPFIAGGYLATILITAGAGAAAGGLLGGLAGAGMDEDEAKHYDEQFRSGRTVVTVNAPGRSAEAMEILRSHGGHSYGIASDTSATLERTTTTSTTIRPSDR